MADEVSAAPLPGPKQPREGFAHGRFQVLHTKHLEYLLAGQTPGAAQGAV
ncbi:hypothetical protein [Micromonospora sp. RTGN7]|nr:hypothetical protein [Micromonospora sp. RTGN7]